MSRTGLTTRIRDHIRAHPDCNSLHVAAALGEKPRQVQHRLTQLAATGQVIATVAPRTGSRTPINTYALHLGTPMDEAQQRQRARQRAAERSARRRQRKASEDFRRSEATRAAESRAKVAANRRRISDASGVAALQAKERAQARAVGPAETVADFIARGGQPEVLRGFVHQPDFRRRAVQYRRVQGEA